MKSYDIVGYAIDGRVFCEDCAPSNADEYMDPIFAGSEWDCAPSCDECLCALDVCVIGYVHETIDDSDAPCLADTLIDHADLDNR